MKPVVKCQHTVPRFYLRRFASTDGRGINIADRNTLKKVAANISDAAVVKNIYTLPADGNQDPMALENAFCEIESDASIALRTVDFDNRFSQPVKAKLAPFLASQLKRVTLIHEKHKLHHESMRDPQRVIAYVLNHRAYYDRVFGPENVEKFIEDIAENRVALRLTAAEMMFGSQRNIKAYVEILMDMTWCLIKNRTPVFITSDNPVFVRRRGVHDDPGLVGLERKDLAAELYFPLSPRTLLIANWDGRNPHRNPIGELRARELNRLTVCCSNRFVYGNVTPGVLNLLELHRDFRLSLPDWEPTKL